MSREELMFQCGALDVVPHMIRKNSSWRLVRRHERGSALQPFRRGEGAMSSLHPPVCHPAFKKGSVRGAREPRRKALHPCLWTCHLSQCGSHREKADLSSLSRVGLFLHCDGGLQLPMSSVPELWNFPNAEGSRPD
jgi:hypothetical protein